MQFSHQQRKLLTPAVVPRTYDIMCGSGHYVFSHPGNVEFRSTVEENAENYANASTKMLKSRVAKLILAKVRATGARILKKDPVYETWHVATNQEKVMRDKITNYLRAFFLKSRRSRVVDQRPSVSPDPLASNERDRAGKQVEKKNGISFFQLQVCGGVSSATPQQGGSCPVTATLPPLPPCETQDSSISVRTIQQMQASPTSGSDLLDSWMWSLFDTLIEEPFTGESTTTKGSTMLPLEMFDQNSFSSPSILSITTPTSV